MPAGNAWPAQEERTYLRWRRRLLPHPGGWAGQEMQLQPGLLCRPLQPTLHSDNGISGRGLSHGTGQKRDEVQYAAQAHPVRGVGDQSDPTV